MWTSFVLLCLARLQDRESCTVKLWCNVVKEKEMSTGRWESLTDVFGVTVFKGTAIMEKENVGDASTTVLRMCHRPLVCKQAQRHRLTHSWSLRVLWLYFKTGVSTGTRKHKNDMHEKDKTKRLLCVCVCYRWDKCTKLFIYTTSMHRYSIRWFTDTKQQSIINHKDNCKNICVKCKETIWFIGAK